MATETVCPSSHRSLLSESRIARLIAIAIATAFTSSRCVAATPQSTVQLPCTTTSNCPPGSSCDPSRRVCILQSCAALNPALTPCWQFNPASYCTSVDQPGGRCEPTVALGSFCNPQLEVRSGFQLFAPDAELDAPPDIDRSQPVPRTQLNNEVCGPGNICHVLNRVCVKGTGSGFMNGTIGNGGGVPRSELPRQGRNSTQPPTSRSSVGTVDNEQNVLMTGVGIALFSVFGAGCIIMIWHRRRAMMEAKQQKPEGSSGDPNVEQPAATQHYLTPKPPSIPVTFPSAVLAMPALEVVGDGQRYDPGKQVVVLSAPANHGGVFVAHPAHKASIVSHPHSAAIDIGGGAASADPRGWITSKEHVAGMEAMGRR
ncbi:hypothetical protein BCR44DRAFT_95877 [Catenaria anguillulae PL171]|uniref:Uncharacterized protein n=1 Tax=Catenaria anguillulae PL171 TaxID=765915 RepID=A0A1Y2I2X4_9FUNG|nr:hypothetical protein BCR44DRAFT_95877 [Catenaria anguillulae PL171]